MGAAKTSKRVYSAEQVEAHDGYQDFHLAIRSGTVRVRLYPSNADRAVLMVGGVSGDFDSPAGNLYPRLAQALQKVGVASLRVQFRDPIDLDDSTNDVLAAVEFLAGRDLTCIGAVGHSFGGAVVIQAALRARQIVTVVTLATQGFGTEGVEDIAPRPILFIHGYDDEVLPPVCSIDAYDRAGEPKDLMLLEGTRHVLNESADTVFQTVYNWLTVNLRQPGDFSPDDTSSPR